MVNPGRYLGLIAGLCASLLTAGGASAQSERCRLALLLALDVSSSVDAREYDLQRLGLAAALNAPDVRHALLSGAPGYVALAVYEWSGFYQHKLQLDWTALVSPAAIDAAVATLADMTRSHDDFPTSLGPALGYGSQMLSRGPSCARQVIDVSGDGVNNYRYGPRVAYKHFPLENVTVNGLAILGDDPRVLGFYRDEVLKGPGAFLEIARGFDDFQGAMTRKLYREISDIQVGAAPLAPRSAKEPEG
ncbi:MAG: DUF1194 domain-containing protein [Pseudomonadota bacterium]